jgi:aspartate aminotransferase-like enzyme
MTGLRFKAATEPHEFEQVHRLNYRTFVEEIPQHAANAERVLVDGRCGRSTFFIALRDDRVVGMIAVSDQRPFSLDAKLPDLDALLPAARSLCEVRLLAVEPGERTGLVFRGLVEQLARYCLARGHDLAIISGTVRQLRLYGHLGFLPFGPLVGTEDAAFQPMYLTLDALRDVDRALFHRSHAAVSAERPAFFAPGPVEPTAESAGAMAAASVPHRAPAFIDAAARVRERLRTLTGARHVALLLGSGTLANDVVAAQLRGAGPGLVLSHGEFGERLADHASRWGLDHGVLRLPWGSAFDAAAVDAALAAAPQLRWLWLVLCETSTGVLTDLRAMQDVCDARGVRLCVDAISALGTMPLDLGRVHLASGVSTKGLGAPPGLALVFHNCPVMSRPDLPRYLDLALYGDEASPPFTHSSQLMSALDVSLQRLDDARTLFGATATDGAWLRAALLRAGFSVVAPAHAASPAVVTVDAGSPDRAAQLGLALEAAGYLPGWRSGYLQRRGWIQFALMGAYRRECLGGLVRALQAAAATAPAELPRSA